MLGPIEVDSEAAETNTELRAYDRLKASSLLDHSKLPDLTAHSKRWKMSHSGISRYSI